MPHLLDISEETRVRARTCVLPPQPTTCRGRSGVKLSPQREGRRRQGQGRLGKGASAEKGKHVSVRAAAGLGIPPGTSFPLGLAS